MIMTFKVEDGARVSLDASLVAGVLDASLMTVALNMTEQQTEECIRQGVRAIIILNHPIARDCALFLVRNSYEEIVDLWNRALAPIPLGPHVPDDEKELAK